VEIFDGGKPWLAVLAISSELFFLDARVGKHVNISTNVGYHLNSSIKADIGGTTWTLLNRPDELLLSAGIDFPVNEYFQPIVETRWTKYLGTRTTNAFENDPWDVIGGFRVFPKRWFGFSFAYRRHMNQQDAGSLEDTEFDSTSLVVCTQPSQGTTPPSIFNTGHYYIYWRTSWIRDFRESARMDRTVLYWTQNPRLGELINKVADVTGLNLGADTVYLPCPAGSVPRAGSVCRDGQSVTIAVVCRRSGKRRAHL
jgi:hypothetical protein